ncbi:MAG: hypothetical protein SGI73_16305 [Chloroflexota bacterium]|nr:hypothetical protein [Chloroflexota bacterium]
MLSSYLTAAFRLLLMLMLSLCGGGLMARALPGAVVAYNDFADRGGRIRSIFVLDAQRADLGAREWTRHVPQPFYYHQSNLSLDGRKLVYFSRATGRAVLYGLDIGGANGAAFATDGNTARVLNADGDNLNVNPVWSPDGQYIAYTSARGTGLDIYVMRADRGGEQVIARSAEHESRPAWSPDGRALAYQVWLPESIEIFTLGVVDGTPSGAPRRLTDNRAVDTNPSWSPDGRWIAYESNEWTRGSVDIALIEVATGERRPITPRAVGSGSVVTARYTQPVWLANGRQIAFIAVIGERSYIAVTSVDADSSDAVRLLAPTRTDALWALWLPPL